MDDKILYFYWKAMNTLDIVVTFKKLYDAHLSSSLVSWVTKAVIEQVI